MIDDQIFKATEVYFLMRVYDLALDAVLFFLFFAIIAQISGKSMAYVVPLTILAVLVDLAFKLFKRKNIVDEIEGREVEFGGSLKTAYEYKGARNVIVEDLLAKTSGKLEGLRYSVFLNQEGVAERIGLAFVMAFIILSIMFLQFQDFVISAELKHGGLFEAAKKTIMDSAQSLSGGGNEWEVSQYGTKEEEEKIGGPGGGKEEGYSEGPLPGKGSGVGEEIRQDIYGEPGSANLWGKDLSMQIHPEYGGDVDVEYRGGSGSQKEFELGYLESAQQYSDYPVKQADLVKKYFEKIIEEER